ncbi:MAG: Gfo/Idh/MocA family protein [Armatimonadota bacterium]
MKRITLLSAAHLHADSYVAELKGRPDVLLAGVWDHDAARRGAASARYGIPELAGIDEALSGAHGALVCSENVHHEDLVLRCAEAKVPVLCEKPLATTPDAAKAMVDACAAAGIPLMTAFPCRFSASWMRFKEMVGGGAIGELLALRGTNQGMCPGGWFVDKALSGGGAVMDHTVHVTDLLRDLLGDEVERVHCEADSRLLHGGFDDTGFLTFDFVGGTFATLDASWSRPKSFPTWGNVTLYAVGTKGTLEMDMFAQDAVLFNDREMRVRNQHWGSSIDGGLVDAFLTAVETGEVPQGAADGVDGLRAVEVVEAAYASVASGSPESVRRR